MSFSQAGRRNLLATSADEPIVVLAEITHADLAVPIRVANDTQAITVEGNEFVACPFTLTKPDDVDQQTPTASISVDNIGRDLTQWLEVSGGGKGAKLRMIAVRRSDPSVLEFDMTMDLTGLSINPLTVDGSLGYKNTLLQSAVAVRYDPITSPGMW